MTKLNSPHSPETTPPRKLLPVLERIKSGYLLWTEYHTKLPKTHRYSLGTKIDTLFIETIEAIAIATFLPKEEKKPYVRLAIRKLDTTKILLLVAWETRALETKRYASLLPTLEEAGKMLGGWNGQLMRNENSPAKAGEK